MSTLDGIGVLVRPLPLSFTQWQRRLRWRLSRPTQRCYAKANGFFWRPCPICSVPYGGHEWRPGHNLPGEGICPLCVYEIGEAHEAECIEHNHEPIPVHGMLNSQVTHELNGAIRIKGTFNLDLPPSHIYCSRCFLEFDPLTREPIGRPTSPYRGNL